MNYALETKGLGKRYRQNWALQDCDLQLPIGRVAGLVGLNGAGKTTLMRLAAGLITPTTGSLRVCDKTPSPNDRSFLSSIGFVPQERTLYPDFTVHDMFTLGRKLNANWDRTLADQLLDSLNVSQKQRVGKLSGGQQAQLALVMALAKKPALLLLDEPLANVDPVARREFMKILMKAATEKGITIFISSHIITELEPICDYLVILSSPKILLADDIERLLNTHKRLIVPEQDVAFVEEHIVLHRSQTGRQLSLLLRLNSPLLKSPSWQEVEITLEDIVLAYLEQQSLTTKQTMAEKLEV
jgi:ABC-2 type transport system ATP-binding protein